MDDYFAKPIGLEQLREALERWAPKDLSHANGAGADRSEPAAVDEGRLVEIFGSDFQAAGAFLADVAREFRDLCDAIAREAEPARKSALAHTLKGVAANAGAPELCAAAARVEEQLGATGEARLDDLLLALERFEQTAKL